MLALLSSVFRLADISLAIRVARISRLTPNTQTQQVIDAYIELICRRASGKTPTTAEWVRRFVAQHKAYEGDSVINDEVAFDLLSACRELAARNEVPGTTPRSYIPAAGASKADTEAELDGNAIFAGLKGAARTELRRFSSSDMIESHSPRRKTKNGKSKLGQSVTTAAGAGQQQQHGNGAAAVGSAEGSSSGSGTSGSGSSGSGSSGSGSSGDSGSSGVVVRTERGAGLAEERAILDAAAADANARAIERQADAEGEAAAAEFVANEATMRGSSFVKEVQASQCSLVRRLLEKYRCVRVRGRRRCFVLGRVRHCRILGDLRPLVHSLNRPLAHDKQQTTQRSRKERQGLGRRGRGQAARDRGLGQAARRRRQGRRCLWRRQGLFRLTTVCDGGDFAM